MEKMKQKNINWPGNENG